MNWPFLDPPDSRCYTTALVMSGSPILRVYHDYEGDWQFHGDATQSADPADGRIVCLADMVDRDASVTALHDLPCGWRAERASAMAQWTRFLDHPFPTFAENGYYLEDAVWLSQTLKDIVPPDAHVRENLVVGQYVKLVFRFAAEDAERQDDECERMWVVVTDLDDDGSYRGTIENDPFHDAARLGDTVAFHPVHVAVADNSA
jgi:hypothetical protein